MSFEIQGVSSLNAETNSETNRDAIRKREWSIHEAF